MLFPLLGPDLVRAAALWRTLHPGHQTPASGPGDWPLLPHEVQVSIRVSASACLGEEEPESQGKVQVRLQVRVKGQGQQDSPAKLTKGEVKISRKKIRKREI